MMDYPENSKKKYFIIIGITILGLICLSTLVFFFFSFEESPLIKMVSGTEYISGEEGQIIVRLSDYKSNPIEDANCFVSLLYPDKSFLFIDRTMQQTTVQGNYYTAFTTPEIEGIYEEHITCIYNDNSLKISSSFHVSTGLNLVREISNSQREQYESIIESDKNIEEKIKSLEDLILMIDTNLNSKINSLQQDTETIKQDIANVDNTINQNIEDKFSSLNSRFKSGYQAMYQQFE